MSNDVCINPIPEWNYSTLTCELPEPTAPSVGAADLPAPRALSQLTGDLSSPESLLMRNLKANRHLLARQVFGDAPPPRSRSIFEVSPLAFSLWAALPVACSSEPSHVEDGGGSSDGSTGTGRPDAGTSQPPAFNGYSVHTVSPCGMEGMIPDVDEGWGVCANYATGNHHLFRWDPTVSGSAESVTSLTNPPDQLYRLSTGEILITTHQNPGIAIIDTVAGSEGLIAFPGSLAISGSTSSGRSVSSVSPSFPKGIVEIGDQIFIATSNLDLTNHDYLPGTILAYSPATWGFQALRTSGFNPTGLTSSAGLLLAVSSGALNREGQATSPAYLDVFDPNSHVLLRSVPLGTNGAGVSGELAVSPDGNTLVLPTADNSGRLIVVNLQTLQVSQIDLRAQGVSGSRIFFTNLQVGSDGRYAWASNFNDGRTYVVDLTTGLRVDPPAVLDTNTGDGLGLSDGLLRGRDLYIGRGSEILQARFE